MGFLHVPYRNLHSRKGPGGSFCSIEVGSREGSCWTPHWMAAVCHKSHELRGMQSSESQSKRCKIQFSSIPNMKEGPQVSLCFLYHKCWVDCLQYQVLIPSQQFVEAEFPVVLASSIQNAELVRLTRAVASGGFLKQRQLLEVFSCMVMISYWVLFPQLPVFKKSWPSTRWCVFLARRASAYFR